MTKEEFLSLRVTKQTEWLTLTTCKTIRSTNISSISVNLQTTEGIQEFSFKPCMLNDTQVCCRATHVMLNNTDTGRDVGSHYASRNKQATHIACCLIMSSIPNQYSWITDIANYYTTISLYAGKRFSSTVYQSVPYM